MPPNPAYRCDYVIRFYRIARQYDLLDPQTAIRLRLSDRNLHDAHVHADAATQVGRQEPAAQNLLQVRVALRHLLGDLPGRNADREAG